MRELLKLMEDGQARSIEELAVQLKTSEADIRRQMEYLEHARYLRRVSGCGQGCSGCSSNCIQAESSLNALPVFWEFIQNE